VLFHDDDGYMNVP